MADENNTDEVDPTVGRDEATTHADLYHRHGNPDPGKWEEQPAVTGRPNDTPLEKVAAPSDYAVPNTTMADRAKQREVAMKKQDKTTAVEEVTADDAKPAAKSSRASKKQA